MTAKDALYQLSETGHLRMPFRWHVGHFSGLISSGFDGSAPVRAQEIAVLPVIRHGRVLDSYTTFMRRSSRILGDMEFMRPGGNILAAISPAVSGITQASIVRHISRWRFCRMDDSVIHA